MAQEKYSFFNSATGDERSYDADAMASAMRALAISGVSSLEDGLRITAEGSTMRTLAEPGMAVLRGYFYELRDDGGATLAFTHATTADADRIDRIVLRLDLTKRTISMVKKEGTAAGTPVPPTLTRSDAVFELSLAQVRVRAGNSAVLAADVLDERPDESVCGAALPEGVKLSTLWNRMPKREATVDAAGLMSTTDKGRLDGLHAAITPDATDNELDVNGYKLVNTDMAFDGETEAGEGGTVRGALKDMRVRLAEVETELQVDEADVFVHVYEYAYDENSKTHLLTGAGSNGRVKIAKAYENGDVFKVNGVSVEAYANGGLLTRLPKGQWATFVYDAEEKTINFKQGGSEETFSWVIAASEDALPEPSLNDFGKEVYCFVTSGREPDSVVKIHSASIYSRQENDVALDYRATTLILRCYAEHTGSKLRGFSQSKLVAYMATQAFGLNSETGGGGTDIVAYRLKSGYTAADDKLVETVCWEKLSGKIPETLPIPQL